MASAKEKKDTQHVLVCARLRPFNSLELECGARNCLEIKGRDINLQLAHGTKRYTFDRIFDSASKQEDVYKTIIDPMIAEIMQGYNCTVFAYGQTGTGKTYTMVGNQVNPTTGGDCINDPHIGIIPRTLDNLFTLLSKNADADFTVRVSYLELYNEILIDLLSCDDKVLKIYEDQKSKGSVRVHGLEEVTVFNKREVFDILQKGSEKRMTASTLMNTQSSRSHTVFTITFHSRELTPEGEELVKTGKLNLVDLAGSENITKSGAVEKRAREAGSINQSLLTLGRVIKALVENSAHIPYRESKLTRILQDSLGGKTKTAIIATISPASNNLEETMSTLDYAFRARNITNRPEINQRMSKKALIQKYLEEIDRLKKDVQAARTQHGVYLNPENYDMMVKESEKQKESLLKSIEECSIFESRVKELDRIREELEEVYSVAKSDLSDATLSLKKSKSYLKQLLKERRIQQELIDKFDETQTAFHQHSKVLSEALHEYMKDQELLTSKLDYLYSIMDSNELTSVEFLSTHSDKHKFIEDQFKSMMGKINSQSEDIKKNVTANAEVTNNMLSSFGAALDHCQCMIEKLHNNTKQLVSTVYTNCSNTLDKNHEETAELVRGHCMSLEIISNTLSNEMAQVTDTISVYKRKLYDEKHLFRSELARLVVKIDASTTENKSSLNKVCNEIKQFITESTAETESLKESTDVIYNTYLGVDNAMCNNLDALSTIFTKEIAEMKDKIQNNYRAAIKSSVDQQKTRLDSYDTTCNSFVSKLQTRLQGMQVECDDAGEEVKESVAKMGTQFRSVHKEREETLVDLSSLVDNVKPLINSYKETENKMKIMTEQLATRKEDIVKEMQAEQSEILNNHEENLNAERAHIEGLERELTESRVLINTNSLDYQNKTDELNSTMAQQGEVYVSEMNELIGNVNQFVNTLTFPKRKGDTPKGKHSVVTATPKRVSKNILLEFPDCHETDEEDSDGTHDITF